MVLHSILVYASEETVSQLKPHFDKIGEDLRKSFAEERGCHPNQVNCLLLKREAMSGFGNVTVHALIGIILTTDVKHLVRKIKQSWQKSVAEAKLDHLSEIDPQIFGQLINP